MSRTFADCLQTRGMRPVMPRAALWVETAQDTSILGPLNGGRASLPFDFGQVSVFPEGPAIQGLGRVTPARARRAAAQGISGASGPLPHFDAIQRSFGRHSIKGIQAHRGREARAGALSMGAQAFAYGDHVAFCQAPNLFTAAHEAAHVVQQRHGAVPASGLGQEGDAHERLANSVAERVLQGQSSESLLDQVTRPGAFHPASSAPAVQRMILSLGDAEDKFRFQEMRYLMEQFPKEKRRFHSEKPDNEVWNPEDQPQLKKGQQLLRTMTPTEDLRIIGHGWGSEQLYGGYRASELAIKLKRLGLPKGYSGNIWLHGCYTGLRNKKNVTYIEQLYYNLVDNGYHPEVYGLRGSMLGGDNWEGPYEVDVAKHNVDEVADKYSAEYLKDDKSEAKVKDLQAELDKKEDELIVAKKIYGETYPRQWLKATELIKMRRFHKSLRKGILVHDKSSRLMSAAHINRTP